MSDVGTIESPQTKASGSGGPFTTHTSIFTSELAPSALVCLLRSQKVTCGFRLLPDSYGGEIKQHQRPQLLQCE